MVDPYTRTAVHRQNMKNSSDNMNSQIVKKEGRIDETQKLFGWIFGLLDYMFTWSSFSSLLCLSILMSQERHDSYNKLTDETHGHL